MGKKAKIAMWAMREEFLRGKTQEDMIEVALSLIDSVAGEKPDLICFPEIFLKTGGDTDNPRWAENGQIMLRRFGERARALRCYIVTSLYEPSEAHPGMKYNCSVLIDRDGQIAGVYRKMHTVYEESTQSHVLPGAEPFVFDTDFGRIGLLTCFDIGWRDAWSELARLGARLVIWSAAYDGGNLLDAYAAVNMYYVASTVRTNHARIINPAGHTLAESSRWNGLAMAVVDLSAELYHIDRQWQKIDGIRRALGSAVSIQTFSEENCFLLESNAPDWPVERIEKEFGLTSYRQYHAEADALQRQWRALYPETF